MGKNIRMNRRKLKGLTLRLDLSLKEDERLEFTDPEITITDHSIMINTPGDEKGFAGLALLSLEQVRVIKYPNYRNHAKLLLKGKKELTRAKELVEFIRKYS